MKHTPGPWRIASDWCGVIITDNYEIDVNTPEDAHLIAAAPELYAALRVTAAALQAIVLNGLVAEDAKVMVKGDEAALTVGEILNAADLILGKAVEVSS